MGKKMNKLVDEDDQKLLDAVRGSAQQIWQAGLGAFAVAEKEGGKIFSKLVKDGAELQKRTRHLAEVKVPEVTESMTKMAENINKQAAESWDKLEQVFEDRVSRTLTQLGVPSKKEIQLLNDKLNELAKKVALLSAKKTSATTIKRAAKPAAKEPDVSKTAPKKPRVKAKVISSANVSAVAKTKDRLTSQKN